MRRLGNKLREGRLGWFGHVKQREPGYVGQTVLNHDRKERKRKAEETAQGHNPGRYSGGRSGERRCAGQDEVESYDTLWRPLTR